MFRNPYITVELKKILDRPKAILVLTKQDKEVWLPKKLITITREWDEYVRFEIPENIAIQKGIN